MNSVIFVHVFVHVHVYVCENEILLLSLLSFFFLTPFSSLLSLFLPLSLSPKVFESWEQRGIDYSAPISSEIIAKLKRTSRLLHFCSSPLLFFSEAKSPTLSSSKGASEGESGTKGGGSSIEEQVRNGVLK